MVIKLGNFEFSEVWDGVFYKKLSCYPQVTDWEIRNLLEFMEYEKCHGRECTIECEDKALLSKIKQCLKDKDTYIHAPRPVRITECTACPKRKGCMTEYICHTTSLENAVSILKSGTLLSDIRARNLSVEKLMEESRNTANDPADYFSYIMFAWGNCQAGDRLVMERKLGRFPDEKDLSSDFTPGVRFYFRYDELIKHPNVVFVGVLPMKVKDEIVLVDWVYAVVIPMESRQQMQAYIPEKLKDKVMYIQNDCRDIWEWSEKVYCAIEDRKTAGT